MLTEVSKGKKCLGLRAPLALDPCIIDWTIYSVASTDTVLNNQLRRLFALIMSIPKN